MFEKWLKRNPDKIKTEKEMRGITQSNYYSLISSGLFLILVLLVHPLFPNLTILILIASIMIGTIMIMDLVHIRYWDTRVQLLRLEQKIDKIIQGVDKK